MSSSIAELDRFGYVEKIGEIPARLPAPVSSSKTVRQGRY
jgi:hypothetical protein